MVIIEINGHANLIIHHNEKLKFKSYLNTFVPSVDARILECSIPAHSNNWKNWVEKDEQLFLYIKNEKLYGFFFSCPGVGDCVRFISEFNGAYISTHCVCQVANSHSNYIHKA